MELADRLEAALGARPEAVRSLAGGSTGSVSVARMPDGARLAVKQTHGGESDTAQLEARMLRHLAEVSDLPVPAVHHAEPGLLVMAYLESGGGLGPAAQADCGRHIARLHRVAGERFGLDYATVIGPLAQPNPRVDDWLVFFRNHRLLSMAGAAAEAGRLPPDLHRRTQALAERLDTLIVPPEAPELVHGDLWGGNILSAGDRIAGFIDPAIYYGHGEMDLAFITLFGSAGEAFFKAYQEIRPIAPGFFDERRDLYNLWPLLVHIRLFGGSYVSQFEGILARLGA